MDIKLKSNSKKVIKISFIICIFSIVSLFITSGDVVIHKEYIESKGFYKSEAFMSLLNSFANDVINLSTNYGNGEAVNVSDDELKKKRDELETKKENEISLVISQFNSDINIAEMKNQVGEVEQLKSSLKEKVQRIEDNYSDQVSDGNKMRQAVIEDRLNEQERLEKRINNFKNIKYVAKNTKDGAIRNNVTFNQEDIEREFKNNCLVYFKIYADKSAFYKGKYDSNIEITDSDAGWGDFSKITYNVGNSDIELYLGIPKEFIGMDDVQYAYQEYRKISSGIYGELFAAIISLIFFIFSTAVLIINRKLKDEFKVSFFDKIPIEAKMAAMVLIISLIQAFLQVYYVGFLATERALFDLALISSCSSLLMLLIKTIKPLCYKNARTEIISRSILYNIYNRSRRIRDGIKELMHARSIFFKASSLFVSAVFIILPLAVITGVVFASYYSKLFGLVGILVILIFVMFISYYAFNKLILLNKIISGAEIIAEGDLKYTIDIRGKGNLQSLANNINNMKVGLKNSIENEVKSERLKTELITNVSHDLKTPLTSIINYVDLLKKEDISSSNVKGYVEILDRKSQRLKVLIEDLFEASKAASGTLELNMEKLEITSLLKQTLAEFEEKISLSELDFRMSYPENKLYIMADGKKLWRVFENLIGNVLKYSLKGTRVYVNVNDEGDKVKISMKNISAYELDMDPQEILERFKRGDQSRNTEGSGLGLSIAKSLVEIQDGRFNIEIDGDLFKANVELNKVD